MPLPRNPTAQDFFKLYITDQIIDHFVVQTNLYAQQFIEQHQNNLRHTPLYISGKQQIEQKYLLC